MSAGLLAILSLQWLALIVLALLVVALVRQVGVLHERLGPVGALTMPGGPAIGSAAPEFTLPSLNGGNASVGGRSVDGRSTLLFFLSPSCPVCKSLLPVLTSMAREQQDQVRLVLASDGDEPDQIKMIARERLAEYPFVLSTALGIAHGIGKLPYAVLIDGDGKIVAKGLVNSREHIESLFEAERTGIASIQDYMGGATSQ